MGGGHGHADFHHLLVGNDSALHRMSPQVKLVALFVFVIATATTPRHATWAFGIHGAVLSLAVAMSRVPLRVIARRILIVTPFIVFAVFVPLLADGQTTRFGPLHLSVEGLWAAWNIVAKTILGATASILLTATTPIPELLAGLTRLHVPAAVVSIIAFMVRYLDLIVDQLNRTRQSMTARCHDPRWLWQSKPLATAAGTLFVRTYERGERIHNAMVARGFTGRMPDSIPTQASPAQWVAALSLPLLALSTTLMAVSR